MGYILNDEGIQTISTVFNAQLVDADELPVDGVTQKGDDHCMEELHLHLDAGAEKYASQSYFSRMAGRKCFLVARSFYSRIGLRYVLVLEMLYPG